MSLMRTSQIWKNRWSTLTTIVVVVLSLGVSWPVEAQTAMDTYGRVLRESRDFRARTRAAIALGSLQGPDAIRFLLEALGDRSPSVRSAAISSLSRTGDSAAFEGVRAALSDSSRSVREEARRALLRMRSTNPEQLNAAVRSVVSSTTAAPPIRWRRARYAVRIGDAENRSNVNADYIPTTLRREIQRYAAELEHGAFLSTPPNARTTRRIRRRNLATLRLEPSIQEISQQDTGDALQVRCEVSIMILDDASGAIRGALNGAATSRNERQGPRDNQMHALTEQAIAGAIRSAMRGADAALRASANH